LVDNLKPAYLGVKKLLVDIYHMKSGLKDKDLNVPWREIKGMRNILAHEYFGVKLETIWETICSDLPNYCYRCRRLFWIWSDLIGSIPI